jgi:uncharacterized membrane protein
MTFTLLASSRLQLLPFFLCFLVLFLRDKNFWRLGAAFVSLALVCAWVLIAGKYTVDHRVPSSIASSQVALLYLQDPSALAQVIAATLTDGPTMRGYFTSFFGMLGWLTATFPGKTYIYLLAGLLMICGASFSLKPLKQHVRTSALFLLIACLSIFLILFAMLTTWTPYPSTTIIGVQGRYFLIPALLLSYGFFMSIAELSKLRRLSALALVLGFTVYSLCSTINLLLVRYYVSTI